MIERTLRPRKSDGGHSIIKVSTIRNYAGRERTALTCQCGKRMTGWGDRAFYSYATHRKAVML